jgi:hypothetical protein
VLASITPLGQRGRYSSYGEIVVALICGAALGGIVVGAAWGALGAALIGGLGTTARAVLLGFGLVVAGAVDLRLFGTRVPSGHRQVNENWLGAYRGWVTGLGFGVQLGVGSATVVSTAGVYAVYLAAFLTGSVLSGAAVGFAFGVARGLISLMSSRVQTSADLARLTMWIERYRLPVAKAVGSGMLVCGVLLIGSTQLHL